MKSLSTSQKILLVLFFGLVFLYSFNQINNSDTFYHLKSAQYILDNFKIPTHDIFSLSAYGAYWVPHEWLAQIIFYLVYIACGFWGLIVFCALLGVLTYFILWRLAFRKGVNFYLSLLIMFILNYLTLELWVPRPQVFSYLSFAVLLYFLESYRDKPGKKQLIGSVLAIWFWANTNASFVLGLAVIGLYLISEAIGSRWRGWSGKNLSLKDIKNLGIAAAAAVALGVFATPAGYRELFYSFYVQQVANYLSVTEWKPITVFLYETQAQLFVAMIFLTDAFFAWWFLFRKESRDMTFFGLAAGVSLMPFISIRHVGFWPIALFVPAAISLSAVLKNFLARFSGKAVSAFLIVLGIIFILGRLFWMPKTPINENIIPVNAVDFIKNNNLRGPLFNLYNEGCYLIFRLWPEDKVFIDGRSEVYRGQPIIDFFTIFGMHTGWEKLMNEKYGINYFFFDSYYNPGIRKFVEPLVDELIKKNFHLVYWDDLTIILVRDTPENKALIDKYGLKYVNPYLDPSAIPVKDNKAAAKEIQSLLERSPQSTIIKDYADRFLGTYSKDRFAPN
ncbi:MAG TPA: hypothetical protein VMV71_01260 [Candidatus Paceibacterota bacterium]|nr:hypothetical protein [Candidatus Paceibacterota bacterium]